MQGLPESSALIPDPGVQKHLGNTRIALPRGWEACLPAGSVLASQALPRPGLRAPVQAEGDSVSYLPRPGDGQQEAQLPASLQDWALSRRSSWAADEVPRKEARHQPLLITLSTRGEMHAPSSPPPSVLHEIFQRRAKTSNINI